MLTNLPADCGGFATAGLLLRDTSARRPERRIFSAWRFGPRPTKLYPRARKYFCALKVFEQGPQRSVDAVGTRAGEAEFQREPLFQSGRVPQALLLLGRSQQIIEEPSFVGTTHGTS